MRKKLLAILSIFVLLALSCELPFVSKTRELVEDIQEVNEEALKTGNPALGKPDLPTPNYTPGGGTYKVGDEVRSGAVTWMVLGWYTSEEAFMPAPTLYVDLLMVNRGSSLTYVQNSYTSKDVQGQESYDVVMTTLGPGERVRTWLTFMLVEAQPSRLVLDADSELGLPNKRIIWDLGPAPCAASTPAILEGEQPITLHAIGETVTLGKMTIQVTGVSYPPDDNMTTTGYKYVHVDLVFENHGSKDLEIDPTYAAYLKDGDGYGYSTAFAMGAATIFPGDKLVTTAEFEVPENVHGLIYEFDGAYLNLGKVFILLEP